VSAEPYPDVASHLRDELRQAWLRVEYQIRVAWGRGLGSKPPEEGQPQVWTPDQMGELFLAARSEYLGQTPESNDAGAGQILELWLKQVRTVEARVRATLASGRSFPLIELVRAFRLTPRQWATLAYALLPEIDPNLVLAYRYLARDASCRGLDGRLLTSLVYDTPESRPLLARDLSANSPLLFYRLLEVQTPAGQNESLLFRRIRPASRLVQMIDGDHLGLDSELTEVAELRAGNVGGMFPAVVVKRAAAALRSGDVVLIVQGQRGLGKRLLLQISAAQSNQSLLIIDGKRLAQQPVAAQQAAVRAILRECRLLDAIPVVPEVDDAVSQQQDRDELPPFVNMLLAEYRGPFAVTVNRERMPRIHQRSLVHIDLEVPPLEVRTAMWRHWVPQLTDGGAQDLAHRFAIPGGVIVSAAQAALAGEDLQPEHPDTAILDRAVAGQLHQRIQRLGKKLATPYGITDLVVDDDVREALVEVLAAVKERRRVRETWGIRGAAGMSVLFSGHPGVGKTMSGTVLAKELGLDIYEVDLSQVVSKWLGETEKNLADLFDAAEPGHVVLLFNEADSLFGKRTSDVKSSNDRYANMETNYLLQRLERFGGLAILTTNLTGAIDQAFKRRFTYDVFFSFPTTEMRVELWRRTLPEAARSEDINFEQLAERYQLSGGFIKVACERAAYLAAAAGQHISNDVLRRTVERMYRERGKLAAVGPLE
jgi:SpoVK/Ycf46/Vps4 family AAA+-type ATPase